MVKWGVPGKILQNTLQTRWSQVNRTLQVFLNLPNQHLKQRIFKKVFRTFLKMSRFLTIMSIKILRIYQVQSLERDDDGAGGGGVDMRGLFIPLESPTNPHHHYLLTNKILNIYLLTKLAQSAIREKAWSPPSHCSRSSRISSSSIFASPLDMKRQRDRDFQSWEFLVKSLMLVGKKHL